MDDKDSIPAISTAALAKLGTSAVLYLVGGAFLLVLTLGTRVRILGIILSLGALLLGANALFSKDREDKKPGIVAGIAGILGLFVQFGIPLLKPFAVFFLGLGGMGLIAAGICNGIMFLRGLKGLK